jgi:acetylglutamate kinase
MSTSLAVIKCGGELLESTEQRRAIAKEIAALKAQGISCILCHGGGPQINRNMEKAALVPNFVRGKRVTDAATLRILVGTLLGEINSVFVADMNAAQIPAIGLSGADMQLLRASPLDSELGFVGKIDRVNTDFLKLLIGHDITPVIACVGVGEAEQLYNINADDVAASVAIATKADSLVLLTNVDGMYRNYPDPSSLISELSLKELNTLLESGTFSAGMIPKAESARFVLQKGLKEVRLANGFRPGALSSCFDPNSKTGTRIYAE